MAALTICCVRNPLLPTSLVVAKNDVVLPDVTFAATTTNNNSNSSQKKSRQWRLCSSSSSSSGGSRVESNADVFSVTSSNKSDVDYLGQSTKGDLNVQMDGQAAAAAALDIPKGPIQQVARIEAQEARHLLNHLGIPTPFSARHSPRGIFCSRTLNLRSISVIGYDMDYTLMHYNVMAWEGRAYDYCLENLRNMGFPVDGLAFDPQLVIRGLVIDKEKGNLVKADRFGYIKRAMHGTRMLSTRQVSEMYGRELVDLKQSRWEFLNTLFSVSEAVAYMQMVDRLDEGAISADLSPLDYKGLFKAVGKALFRAHVEGQLKSEIMSKPELFVEPDPDLPLALLDQKEAGKRLLLITNSDYQYTDKMMQHSFNRFLPNDMNWRDLFELVIVSSRKPEFFQTSHPMYEVVTGEGLMRPCFKAHPGGLYSGGSAQMVESSLNVHGDEILYVGDHIYTDVSQSKVHLRWRTALICRELEEEYSALIDSRGHRATLIELINQKEVVGDLFNQLRLALQRKTKGRPAQTIAATHMDDKELTETMQKLLIVMQRLDEKIAPMLEADGELFNKRWGFLSRAGLWDKSHLMRQIEKYADIYTSRVSNFLHYTPFMYFRAQEQSLAHDAYSFDHLRLDRFHGTRSPLISPKKCNNNSSSVPNWEEKKKKGEIKTKGKKKKSSEKMKKLRWAMDGGGFWDLDLSTPVTLDGVARPVPGDPLPLGLSRGVRLSRHKQVDFFQRFMAMPFVPSFSQKGFSIQRLLSLPPPFLPFFFFSQRWFAAVLGELNVQELVKSFRKNRSLQPHSSSWLQTLKTNLSDKSLYALNFCFELLLTRDDLLLLSLEAYGDAKIPRNKALLHHKFPHHDLIVEAAWPGLFVDHRDCYWDVPFTLAVDLASVSSDSGASYHLCLHNSAGSPTQIHGQPTTPVPATLLPGLCAKCAVSFKKNIDIWKSDAPKLKMVQPYDIFLSNPHISASGIIGAVVSASLGHNSIRARGESGSPSRKGLNFRSQGLNSAILTDLFASVSLSAQHGNFQRLFLDLTRICAHLDFTSGSKFLSGASCVAYDLYNGQVPRIDAVQAICPNATVSFQQQIAGPFSFRIDSGVALDLKKRDWSLSVNNPVFAIEYALQVLGSAKAVAWYSPKQKEFMIELRFFET